MVQNNKVLTVSYGTFSCTLEGFEDSFGTMKAIAEYFRDLASDDRYFGAEPPQPDADMLARIAQREIARQVEARTSNAGIHLRAATPPVPAMETAEAAPQVAEAASQDAQPQQAESEARQPEDNQIETIEATEVQAESIQAEPVLEETIQQDPVLQEPEQAEATDVSEPVADEIEVSAAEGEIIEDAAAADTPAESNFPIIADSTVELFDEDFSAETSETASDEDNSDEVVEIAAEEAVEDAALSDTASSEDAPEAADETEVNLDQIAAVVAESAEDQSDAQPETAEVLEAETVKEAPKPAANSIAAKLQRIRAVVSRTPAEEFSEDQHAEAIKTKADDLSAALTEDVADEEELDNDDLIERALQELKQGKAEETASQVSPETSEISDAEAEKPATDAAPQERDDAPAPQKRRSRVIRVRRSTPEEVAAKQVETPAEPASSLSADDEDELRQELAAVEAELLAATGTKAEEPKAAEPAQLRRSDVSRLMDAADEKLEDPDTAASREAYGHMRAAVTAAQGDTAEGEDDAAADYRKDLASAVQPRRPVVRRRGELADRSQPLKLVAEQRIDETETAAKTEAKPVVRPRRVTTAMKPAAADVSDSGFAKYAQDCGAVELHELLEAAASYLSFVKGQDVFSRPELINKVRATGTEFNREDSMRSFGQLLRDGKIARRQNGRFAASEEIGFQPQDRAAG